MQTQYKTLQKELFLAYYTEKEIKQGQKFKAYFKY